MTYYLTPVNQDSIGNIHPEVFEELSKGFKTLKEIHDFQKKYHLYYYHIIEGTVKEKADLELAETIRVGDEEQSRKEIIEAVEKRMNVLEKNYKIMEDTKARISKQYEGIPDSEKLIKRLHKFVEQIYKGNKLTPADKIQIAKLKGQLEAKA